MDTALPGPFLGECFLNEEDLGFKRTSMNPQVVLQIPSCCELLPTAHLSADKWFLTIVSSHVYLQPLQDIEAFPTTFCWAGERTIIPERQQKNCSNGLRNNVFSQEHSTLLQHLFFK